MYVYCAQCGQELLMPSICSSENWPAGWQINLSCEGEACLCSHTCATSWHLARVADERALVDTVPLAGGHLRLLAGKC